MTILIPTSYLVTNSAKGCHLLLYYTSKILTGAAKNTQVELFQIGDGQLEIEKYTLDAGHSLHIPTVLH